MTVSKQIDKTDGFAVMVYLAIMSNNASMCFSKLEEGGKNRVVPYFGKLGIFYGFSCQKEDWSLLDWNSNQ